MTYQGYGMTIPFDGLPLHAQREAIIELADRGYTDVWSSEADGADAFTPLALASVWAPSLRLGNAIVPAYTRGPATLGRAATEHAASFSWAHTVDALLAGYGRAIADHRARHQRQLSARRSGRRFSMRRGVRA